MDQEEQQNKKSVVRSREVNLTVSDGFKFGFGFGAGTFVWGLILFAIVLLGAFFAGGILINELNESVRGVFDMKSFF